MRQLTRGHNFCREQKLVHREQTRNTNLKQICWWRAKVIQGSEQVIKIKSLKVILKGINLISLGRLGGGGRGTD